MQSPSKGMPTAFIASRSTDNLAQSAAAVCRRRHPPAVYGLQPAPVIYSKYSENSNQSFTFWGRLDCYGTAFGVIFCIFVDFTNTKLEFLYIAASNLKGRLLKKGYILFFFIQTPIFSQQGYLNRDLNTSSNVLIQMCYLK